MAKYRGSDGADELKYPLKGTRGPDTYHALGDSDVIDGGPGADTMYGGPGNDIYHVDTLADRVIEAVREGTDRVRSTVDIDMGWLPANVENISLWGRASYAHGSRGPNQITGQDYANKLFGQGGNDEILGYGGVDMLHGGSGDDTLYGGSWDYSSSRPAAQNTLYGSAGNDKLYGAGGTDMLNGGDDHDLLFGGAGNDMLRGGGYGDILTGGPGADRFIYATHDSGDWEFYADTITDFRRAEGDKIDLSPTNVTRFVTHTPRAGECKAQIMGEDTVITYNDGGYDHYILLDNLKLAMNSEDFIL